MTPPDRPGLGVTLNEDFEYPLAGIQRVALSDFEAILRSLKKVGLGSNASAPANLPQSPRDLRKSLIVLPFEDLSPGQDNAWFADGLAGEMIDALGHIKSLRILDRKTSIGLRGTKLRTLDIGKDSEIDPDDITRYETVVAPEIQSNAQFGLASFGSEGREAGTRGGGGGRQRRPQHHARAADDEVAPQRTPVAAVEGVLAIVADDEVAAGGNDHDAAGAGIDRVAGRAGDALDH